VDLEPCTTGKSCLGGKCQGGTPIVCDDGNPCTDDACDPGTGKCIATANASSCDDVDPCTVFDQCAFGKCSGTDSGLCKCKNTADCSKFEDGNLCNGTLTCNADHQCVLDPGTVVPDCPTSLDTICAGMTCPFVAGYKLSCNAQDHCEYTNEDQTGWKKYDVWLLIPPGSFQMGQPPGHTVTIAQGYLIQKHEYTVAQYEACNSGSPATCTAASTSGYEAIGWGTNTSSNKRTDHPQNGLTFAQAMAACEWAGGRLPSEAEWEYAASGPSHRKYPWGDAPEPTCANGTAVFDEDQDYKRPWGCSTCTADG